MSAQPLPWPQQAAQEESPPAILQFRPRRPQSPDVTLDEAFRLYKRPELEGRSRETIGEYETHLRRWAEFWDSSPSPPPSPPLESTPSAPLAGSAGAGGKYRIVNPVLPQIDRTMLLEFRSWLAAKTKPHGEPLFTPRGNVNRAARRLRAPLPTGSGRVARCRQTVAVRTPVRTRRGGVGSGQSGPASACR